MAATDRRVRRTRELLRAALLSLLLEEQYERITIQNILDRADVGRSTFYAHFRDKESLLRTGLDELRCELSPGTDAQRALGEADALEPLRRLFEHVEGHLGLGRALKARGGGEIAFQMLHESAADIIRANMRNARGSDGGDATQLEARVQFVSGALMGLVHWWVESDNPYSAEEMFSIFSRLTACGLGSVGHSSPSDDGLPSGVR